MTTATEDKFWCEKLEWKEAGDFTDNGLKVARIKGYHYVIGNHSFAMTGSAGARFMIKFIDGPHKGEIIETTDLWQQGAIDEAYLSRLPDNAVFVI